MKNLLCMAVIFFSFVTASTAQVTPEMLQGTWKIDAIQASGVYFEFATGKITVDESLAAEETVSTEDMVMMADMMKTQMEPFYSNFIKFDNNKILISFGGKTAEGTFKVNEKDGRQYIEVTYPNGTLKEIDFTMNDKLLSILHTGSDEVKMIYKLS